MPYHVTQAFRDIAVSMVVFFFNQHTSEGDVASIMPACLPFHQLQEGPCTHLYSLGAHPLSE